MKNKLKIVWKFLRNVIDEWIDDKAPKLGASLSFFTMFSLAPLLLIVISIAGLLFGTDEAMNSIIVQVNGLIGKQGAEIIRTALKNSHNTSTGIIAIVISLVTLVISATAAFIELQDSLNIIWKVKAKSNRNFIEAFLKDRLHSFALVIAAGFLLLVSLIISAVLSAISNYFSRKFISIPTGLLEVINNVITFGVIFILFASIFMILPNVFLKLKDVWSGALVTAFLFIVGKFLIGLYLGTSTLGSTYGAAGSLVIVLLWVYYSAQILFLGAEFTKVYTRDFGSGIRPYSDFEQYYIETTPHPEKNNLKEIKNNK
jgi:membrane protein